MQVDIRSRKVDITSDVREMTIEKVSKAARFLEGLDHAEVLFSEEKNPRIPQKERCEITVRGHGHVVRAHASSQNQLDSMEKALSKLERQLRRLKTKILINHNKPSSAVEPDEAISLGEIVKTKTFSAEVLTAAEAVERMELLDHDFYLFTDAATGLSSVAYRRSGGDFGVLSSN